MRMASLDALLITDEFNYRYFSGQDLHYETILNKSRPCIMILPLDKTPTLVLNELFVGDAEAASWIRDIRPWTKLPFTYQVIADALRDLGLQKGKIGCELGLEQMLGIPHVQFVELQKNLTRARFTDASDLLWQVRKIKSEAEVRKIKTACEITGVAYRECFEELHPRMSETDVVRLLYGSIVRQGAYPGIIFVTSGNYEKLYAGRRRLGYGDEIWIDLTAMYDGYCSDFSREAVVGKALAKQQRAHDIIVKVTEKLVNHVRPGRRASDLSRLSNRLLKQAGLRTKSIGRIGHGLGMSISEPPSIADWDDTILEPGMIITLEPNLTTNYGIFNMEEDILVTKDGCSILSSGPRTLPIIGN